MICILTHLDVKRQDETGKRPDCKFHHHTSYQKAKAKVKGDEAIWIEGLRAIVIYPCILSYVLQGKISGGGSKVLQLAPVTPIIKIYPIKRAGNQTSSRL